MSTPPPRRITQKDVAREAGVSHVTVSLALRKRREIPLATRKKIEAIAKRLGYSPDPMLGALTAYRQSCLPAAFHSTLGWINNHPQPEELYRGEDFRLYFEGASERARELGYGLEKVNLVEYQYNRKLVQRMLTARGIRSLLIAPLHNHREHVDLDWSRYSAVRLGYSMVDTVLHTVTNSQFRTSFSAVENLVHLGYRRIGFAMDSDYNTRTGGHFLGGYLSAGAHFELEDVSVLNMPPYTPGESDVPYWGVARPWIKKDKLEAIIAGSEYILPHLKRWGYKVPHDIALVSLAVAEASDTISGIHQNTRNVGRTAVDLLVSLFNKQETGVPVTPMHTLVEGRWTEGHTTRNMAVSAGHTLRKPVNKKQRI